MQFKINSKTAKDKSIHEVVDYIINGFGINDQINKKYDIENLIFKWAQDNNVKRVELIATKFSMRDAAQYLDDDIIEQYSHDDTKIEKARPLIENDEAELKTICKFDYDKEDWELITCEDIFIALNSWFGSLYAFKI